MLELIDETIKHPPFVLRERRPGQPTATGRSQERTLLSRDEIFIQDRGVNARLGANRLVEPPQSLACLAASRNGVLVSGPDLGRKSRCLKSGQRTGVDPVSLVDLVSLDACKRDRARHKGGRDDDPRDKRPEQAFEGRSIAGRPQHHLVVRPGSALGGERLALYEIDTMLTRRLAVVEDGDVANAR